MLWEGRICEIEGEAEPARGYLTFQLRPTSSYEDHLTGFAEVFFKKVLLITKSEHEFRMHSVLNLRSRRAIYLFISPLGVSVGWSRI